MKIFVTIIILISSALAGAQVPPAPVLAYPADGARDVSPYATLKWKQTQRAEAYHVQIATDLGFTALFREDSAVADTLLKMNRLADSTSYYWRVRARNAAGFGPFSKTRLLTSLPPLGAGPVIMSPIDFAQEVPLTVPLSWEPFEGADRYHVQVSLVTNFATVVVDDPQVKGTSRTVGPLKEGTEYFWHVRAVGAAIPNQMTAWTKGRFYTAGPASLADPSRAGRGLAARALPGRGVEAVFALAAPGRVKVSVIGLDGRRGTFERSLGAGAHRAEVLPAGTPAGVYLLGLEAAGRRESARITVP